MAAKKKPTPRGRTKKAPVKNAPANVEGALFDRVVGILDQARANVVRAVNSHMVLAYWLIGREIVQEVQGGKGRADYGSALLEDLSRRLIQKYGSGFSHASLRTFRQFYVVYEKRHYGICYPVGSKLDLPAAVTEPAIRHPAGAKFSPGGGAPVIQHPFGAELQELPKSYPMGSKSLVGFSPQLNWSHYRALMRVEKPEARDFYEQEAIAGGWDKRTLERQIHSFYYERLLKSQRPKKMLTEGRQTLTSPDPAIATLKNPYVLEFLGLPEVAALRESDLEKAILSYLQAFLLELGKGFALVARQKRLRIGEDDRYVDLVFYHCRLKFYLLIDLKIGELTHGDVGQMDGYVRMFDDLETGAGDNPTIGLILCAEKNEVVAKYSVLKDRKQIFASKYMLDLPTEEELQREIERERRLLEDRAADGPARPRRAHP
jgi:predicted nuclease of restriction endonuclease-like (RecB) superfamily